MPKTDETRIALIAVEEEVRSTVVVSSVKVSLTSGDSVFRSVDRFSNREYLLRHVITGTVEAFKVLWNDLCGNA